MASAEVTGGALRRVVGFEDLLDGVTDTEVGPVHVAGDHEEATDGQVVVGDVRQPCLLYTSPSPRDRTRSRMPSSA